MEDYMDTLLYYKNCFWWKILQLAKQVVFTIKKQWFCLNNRGDEPFNIDIGKNLVLMA
jgi:hypothetical protein